MLREKHFGFVPVFVLREQHFVYSDFSSEGTKLKLSGLLLLLFLLLQFN